MEIILIAAMNEQRIIGHENSIPWDIPGEQQRFKKVTLGYPLVMGRKTFESIGRPLPGRRNIIVTRNQSYFATGCEVTFSIAEALGLCQGEKKVFIIGGEQLFRECMKLANTLILTIVQEDVQGGDTYFPEFSQEDFPLYHSEQVVGVQPYLINTYRRKKVP